MIYIVSFILSLLPAIALYLWLKNLKGMQEGHPEVCKKALIRGFLCVIPVVFLSATLHIGGNLLHFRDGDPILYQVYYKFIVLAFAEELVKFLTFRRVIRNRDFSWLELTIYMVIVGIGFEIIESIPYMIGSGPIHFLVRGLTLMHAAFGFVMGYFYGKSVHTGKKYFAVIGFLLSFLMHGLYDFTLSDELIALSDAVAIIPVSLAAFSVVLIVMLIRFVVKKRRELA